MRHYPNDPKVEGGAGRWKITITTPHGDQTAVIDAPNWNAALAEARRRQRTALSVRRPLCTGDVVTPMTANAYAARIGVRPGTLKRWLTEGMPALRDWSYGPPATVRIIPVFADAWVSEKHGHSVAIGRRSFIYFARRDDTGAIKIGFSSDPERRPQEIRKRVRGQHGECGRVTLLGQYPGDKRDELALHERFVHARILQEWFRPVPELLKLIEDRCGNVVGSRCGA